MSNARTLFSDWRPVALVMGTAAWGGNEFTPLLGLYRQVSGFSQLTVALLLAVYVLGIVPALLIGGPISDRFGRRPAMLLAAPFSAAGSVAIAVWPHSAVTLALGRILCGIAIGLAMSVGSTWVKELGERRGDASSTAARRASAALSAGFLVGAAAAGGLAQWSPWPTTAPYVLHIVFASISGIAIVFVAETRYRHSDSVVVRNQLSLRVRRRFVWVVMPIAPWSFVAATVGYAVIPSLFGRGQAQSVVVFAALLTVITLAAGLVGQIVSRRLVEMPVPAIRIAMTTICIGLILAAGSAQSLRLDHAVVASAVLGMGYGLMLAAGLAEVQRITPDGQLGAVTGVYFALTYLGFGAPPLFSVVSKFISYHLMLLAMVPIALCAAAISCRSIRRIALQPTSSCCVRDGMTDARCS